MVTQKERTFLTITEAVKIINESTGKKEMVDRINSLEKRQKAPPAPKGSIGIRQAARKYKIPRSTLSYWAKQGYIEVIKRTSNWLYINESSLRKHINSHVKEN